MGLEDSIWLTPKRQKLATNADLLQRIQTIAQALDIEIATPCEVRALLQLGPAVE